ncbi:ccr4-not transcription complex subunit 10 [Anaeramoeba ignava]|uniref:Ccr4-not transcription complex subunit 10 n=1 Tax=Anaeramoeba ignava TaxID=1746090 RepID=A0A9Q0LTW8_ANAIG|nr:ccr4-not transcription complex subunit 10 [Anaeramoeba ignava]
MKILQRNENENQNNENQNNENQNQNQNLNENQNENLDEKQFSIKLTKEQQIQVQLLQIKFEIYQENFENAIKILTDILETNKKSKTTNQYISVICENNLGLIYLQLKKPANSLVHLKRAFLENQTMIKKIKSQTQSHSKKNEKVVKLSPQQQVNLEKYQEINYQISYNIGLALLIQNSPTKAFEAFHLSLKHFYNNPRIWIRLTESIIYVLLGLKSKDRINSSNSNIEKIIGKGRNRRIIMKTKDSLLNQNRYNAKLLKNSIVPDSQKKKKRKSKKSAEQNQDESLKQISLFSANQFCKNALILISKNLEKWNQLFLQFPPQTNPKTNSLDQENNPKENESKEDENFLIFIKKTMYSFLTERTSTNLLLSFICLCQEDTIISLQICDDLLKRESELSSIQYFLAYLYYTESFCLLGFPDEAECKWSSEIYEKFQTKIKENLDKVHLEMDYPEFIENIPNNNNTLKTVQFIFLLNLSTILLMKGNVREAENSIKQCLEISPKDSKVFLTLAYIQIKKKNFKFASHILITNSLHPDQIENPETEKEI